MSIDGMVDRFLQWKLPDSVCSDACAADRTYATRYPGLRSGTNLLTADEARQMIEHVLAPNSAKRLMTTAAEDVLAERQRQISAEGWAPEHDDAHDNHELAIAAACYAAPGSKDGFPVCERPRNAILRFWPWSRNAWKSTTRRRDLVKAGALILAEIERLDRKGDS